MDIDHTYGQDLNLTSSNDLVVVYDVDQSNQRIVRRLLTAIGDYFWEGDYGCGVGSYIGLNLSFDVYAKLKAVILDQIFKEETVAKNPQPVITFSTIELGLECTILYYSIPTQNLEEVSFKITRLT